jgi:hypothetical protein
MKFFNDSGVTMTGKHQNDGSQIKDVAVWREREREDTILEA